MFSVYNSVHTHSKLKHYSTTRVQTGTVNVKYMRLITFFLFAMNAYHTSGKE